MAAQHLKRSFTASLAAALVVLPAAGLLDARAATTVKREPLPITVDAASFEGDIRNNSTVYHDVIISQGDVRVQNGKWTLSGDVRINAGNGSLRSDEAIIYFANNLLTRATITGTPAQFEQQREGGAEPARGHANTIDYETSTGSVSLMNEAWLSDGCNEIRGEKLVYNIRSQSVQAQSVTAAPGSTGNGRIRITIQPQTPSGKPCATPGKKP
jgi:lipopolysaccharide export system protein LptA